MTGGTGNEGAGLLRVIVDLDPKDVWAIDELVEAEHITRGDALRRLLAERRQRVEPKRPQMRTVQQHVEELVQAAIPDPVIAHRTGELLTRVRAIRIRLGYPAAKFVRSQWPELNHRRTAA